MRPIGDPNHTTLVSSHSKNKLLVVSRTIPYIWHKGSQLDMNLVIEFLRGKTPMRHLQMSIRTQGCTLFSFQNFNQKFLSSSFKDEVDPTDFDISL